MAEGYRSNWSWALQPRNLVAAHRLEHFDGPSARSAETFGIPAARGHITPFGAEGHRHHMLKFQPQCLLVPYGPEHNCCTSGPCPRHANSCPHIVTVRAES